MRKMKDSGIEWIGKIPDIWRQTKLKYVTKIRSENGMYSPEQDSYIGLENIVSRSNKLIETETIYESALYSICKKGDILFNKLRPYLAKAIISPIDGFCTGELLNIKHFDGEKRFLWYYLLSDKFIEVVNASTYGAKMPRANTDFILNLPVFLPPLAEQQRIADFLDEKCGEIDSIRSDVQREIEILNDYKKSVITEAVIKGLNPKAKLKDSGIEWIGKIPEHWLVDKFKYHLSFSGLRNPGNAEVLSLYREWGVVPKDSRSDNHNQTSEDTSNYRYVRKGDFVINKMKAWQGSVAVSDYSGIVSPAYFVYAFSDEMFVKRYLHYLLRNISYAVEFKRLSGGIRVGQWDLPREALENTLVLLPPLSEQKAIADYLDEKCSEIDATIADKQKQLETLDEYKKSLIFEYVTGKKEVF